MIVSEKIIKKVINIEIFEKNTAQNIYIHTDGPFREGHGQYLYPSLIHV